MAIDKHSLYSVTPVWLSAALGAAMVLSFVPVGEHFRWLQVTLAAATIGTFVVQLALDRKDGLVNRIMASLGGAVVILAIASGISALLAVMRA